MAASEQERSPKSSRKSSISSGQRAANARPSTIRTKSLAREANRPRTPPTTEESSLTSFPSLSPSVANSPVSSPQSGRQFHSLSAPFEDVDRTETLPKRPALNGLFAGSSTHDGRSALFEDSPKNVRQIPGTMHLQSDKSLEHMISRVGAVALVKQMSEDLAQRDAQITSLQRKAEERESLLRKMLRECEVSNLKIENRLKQLEIEQAASEKSRKVSGNQSEASIDEQMSEAFGDILGGKDTRSGTQTLRHLSKVHGTSSSTPSRRASEELSRHQGETGRKRGTGKGWKSFFTGQSSNGPDQATLRAPMQRTISAQERLQRIHTASQANLRRKDTTYDLFQQSVSGDTSAASSRKPSLPGIDQSSEDLPAIDNDNASTKSGNSFASWATRLVGGKNDTKFSRTESQSSAQAALASAVAGERVSSKSQMTGRGANANGTSAGKVAGTTPKPAASARSTTKQMKNETRNPISAISSSPIEQATRAGANPGPVEMDAILPDSSRPPTLLPYESTGDSSDFLTDRYGFTYDQRRRARQNVPVPTKDRSKRGSRVETLANHRRSWNSMATPDADVASLNSVKSQKSTETTDPSSPVTGDNVSENLPPKKWQDYLKLSNMSTELLSHTPSVAPATNGIAGAESTNDHQKPQITVSTHGSIVAPTSNLEPTQSHVQAGDAEFAQTANAPADSSTVVVDSAAADPVKALLDQLTDIFDVSQREKETRWNEFLRKVAADRRRQGEAYSNDRRSKGLKTLAETALMDGEIIGITSLGIEGKAGRAKWLEFKGLLLGGIPLSLRPKVWAECSGALSSRIPGYYDEMVRTQPQDADIVQQIAMDIPRTLTDNIYFRQGEGMGKLSEVLLAYSQRNPEVGYCQGMNMIAANLILIMPTAEDAFWMLTTLIEKILPDKYYDHSLLTSRADQAVLRQYVSTVLPSLSAHLEALSIDLEALTFQWFLSVFTDCLSAEALFRVWDVMLCTPSDAGGGATFLFQVALALLKLNEKQLLACESPAEVYAYINGKMTDHAISIDGLIKASEALRKVVKKEDIEKRRAVVVEADLEMMRQRDEARKGKARATVVEETMDEHGASAAPAPSEANAKAADGSISYNSVARDEEEDFRGGLEHVSPMPVEEEIQWRG